MTLCKLRTGENEILKDIYDNIVIYPVTDFTLEFVPWWMIEEYMSANHEENWDSAHEKKGEPEIPEKANIVSSNTIFKITILNDGELKLEERVVVYGNRDSEK